MGILDGDCSSSTLMFAPYTISPPPPRPSVLSFSLPVSLSSSIILQQIPNRSCSAIECFILSPDISVVHDVCSTNFESSNKLGGGAVKNDDNTILFLLLLLFASTTVVIILISISFIRSSLPPDISGDESIPDATFNETIDSPYSTDIPQHVINETLTSLHANPIARFRKLGLLFSSESFQECIPTPVRCPNTFIDLHNESNESRTILPELNIAA